MENEIKRIIELAKQLKTQGTSNFEIAKFVHIELGKLVVYDNNYTTKNDGIDVNKNIEGKISENSTKRQKRILEKKTSIRDMEQTCKGMSEIYAAILTEIGIKVKVVGVDTKEDVDGEKREGGSIIQVPETYKCNFDDDMTIKIEDKECRQNRTPLHWYCVVQTEKGEYIQDYLTEMALTRIKIGETSMNEEQLAGFHPKGEHRDRTLNSHVNMNESFRNRLLHEYEKYCKGNNDSNRAFHFVFEKLGDFISTFGFEEAKDFISLIGKSFPEGELTQIPNNINLVKEDEQHCSVACIYQYNGKNYFVRSGRTDSKFPVGEIARETIKEILRDGFSPRRLSDAKKLRDMQKTDSKRLIGKEKFEEKSLSFDLQQLSKETTISGFDEMSKNIKKLQKSNEQEKLTENTELDK